MDRHAEAVQVEVGVARLHGIPCPLDEVSSFAHRLRALRPLQARANTFVLVIASDGHHVRVTIDLVVRPDRREMVDKPDHAVFRKSAECPTSSLSGNYEMTAGRNLQVRDRKSGGEGKDGD